MFGDVNLDNTVSMSDLVYLNKYNAKIITLNDQQLMNADCVYDSSIGGGDAGALLKFLVLAIDSLPLVP